MAKERVSAFIPVAATTHRILRQSSPEQQIGNAAWQDPVFFSEIDKTEAHPAGAAAVLSRYPAVCHRSSIEQPCQP